MTKKEILDTVHKLCNEGVVKPKVIGERIGISSYEASLYLKKLRQDGLIPNKSELK